jgi:hypothetical protein
MKRTFIFIILSITAVSCEKKEVAILNEHESPILDRAEEEIPPEINNFINDLMESMTEKQLDAVRAVDHSENAFSHFGEGMSLRNNELNSAGSSVTRAFRRIGVHHSDDMSSLILDTLAQKIREEPITFAKTMILYREHWAKQDIVAPLDLNCHVCGLEMEVIFEGRGRSLKYPDRALFVGRCPLEHQSYYYHKIGWQDQDSIE